MIEEVTKRIQDTCINIIESAKEGIDWINSNLPKEDQRGSAEVLLQYRLHAKQIAHTINKRPTIALFGESQIGKSYLVNNLARVPGSKQFNIVLPGSKEKLDFLRDMNPEGRGTEATGIVTRFTTQFTHQTGQKPFQLKLLSQIEIVKIILNGYYSDLNSNKYIYKPEDDEIRQKINDLQAGIGQQTYPGITEDDVRVLRKYLTDNFKSNDILKRFSFFWDDITYIAPRLKPTNRWRLFSLLWGGVGEKDFFRDLFIEISEFLDSINFSEEVRCDASAFKSYNPKEAPNEFTLLDVERVYEIFESLSKNKKKIPNVEISFGQGQNRQINRGLLSAVTAEVVAVLPKVTLNHPNRAFLKYADILDFPGARSRENIEEERFRERSHAENMRVFVRGKVAYLFQTYTENYEISTLLYCMHNKQPEVTDIYQYVNDWIGSYIGKNALEREKSLIKLKEILTANKIDFQQSTLNPMFFILTKFNIEMVGENKDNVLDELDNPNVHNRKWNNRLRRNFFDLFSGAADVWISDWSQSVKHFNNSYLLRDPQYSRDMFEEVPYFPKKSAIIGEYEQRLTDLKSSFLSNNEVKDFFQNPVSAWEAVGFPNNTGIDYIIENLTPTCHPILRVERLNEIVNNLLNNTYKELENYYESGDIKDNMLKAKKKMARVAIGLTAVRARENNTFGLLIDKLMLSEDEAWSVYYELQNATPDIEEEDTESDNGGEIAIDKFFAGLGIEIDESRSFGEAIDKAIDEMRAMLDVDQESLEQMLIDEGIDIEKIKLEANNSGYSKQKSKAYLFAEKLISTWVSKIYEMKTNSNLTEIGITRETISLIVEELIKTKNRTKLTDQIAESVKMEVENYAINDDLNVVSKISSLVINKFVKTVGWNTVDEKKRPSFDKSKEPIFASKKISPLSKKDLKTGLDFPGELFFKQWSVGMRASFEANVLHENNFESAEKAISNARLGMILKKLIP